MKKILITFILTFLFFLYPTLSEAGTGTLGSGESCKLSDECLPGFSCVFKGRGDPLQGVQSGICQADTGKIFGKIQPPSAVSNIGIGSQGISNVLNRGIELLFIAGGIIFIFMIVISAVQWITSGGDKEGIGKAKGRLTAAIVGIILLSLAFVLIKLVGQITGFQFFVGQNNPPPTIPTPMPTTKINMPVRQFQLAP